MCNYTICQFTSLILQTKNKLLIEVVIKFGYLILSVWGVRERERERERETRGKLWQDWVSVQAYFSLYCLHIR